MPRAVDPDYAERVATNISADELEDLTRIARDERTTLAHVLRWAVRDYLASRNPTRQDGARVAAVS